MKQTINDIEPNEGIIDLRHYWRILLRAKFGIALFVMLFVILGGILAQTSTPIYQATAKILADPTPPNAARDEKYISSALVFLFFETQYEIIRSRAVANTVVDKLNLVERYKNEQNGQRIEKPNFIEGLFKQVSNLLKKDVKQNDSLRANDDQIRTMLAQTIQNSLTVTGGKQSQVINVSYESDDPELAKEIVNAVSLSYIQFGLQSRLSEVKDTELWLTEQSQELKANLSKAEERLKDFRIKQGIVDSELQQKDANSRMQSLNIQLINAQTRLGEAAESFRQIERLAPNSEELYSLGPVLANRTAGDLVRELSIQESNVSELEKRYREKHPKMIAARSELASVQTSLSREISKIVEQIKRDYQSAQQQVINAEKLITEQREAIQSIQGSTSKLRTLEREVENNRRIYESFMAKLLEANVNSEFYGSNITIIDYAATPNHPIKPRKFLIIIIGLIFGLLAGIGYAILKAALRDTFTNTEMVEEVLNIPCLGITHALGKNELKNQIAELSYIENNRTIFAEGINTIRTAIQFSNIDSPPKVILVTSSSGSEGKSTLATNLAASYAKLGKTILIEVDLRKPSMAKNLNIKTNIDGLTDVLSKSQELERCIRTPFNKIDLSILLSGHIPHNPMEILSSNKFLNLLDELKQKFDYLILDGPPTLPVSDSIILGNSADAVILALKFEETKTSAAKETIKRLVNNNVNVIGGVLTMATPKKMSYYGEHYYGQDYYGTEIKN